MDVIFSLPRMGSVAAYVDDDVTDAAAVVAVGEDGENAGTILIAECLSSSRQSLPPSASVRVA